jgi:hypothetical protein
LEEMSASDFARKLMSEPFQRPHESAYSPFSGCRLVVTSRRMTFIAPNGGEIRLEDPPKTIAAWIDRFPWLRIDDQRGTSARPAGTLQTGELFPEGAK